MLVGSVYSSLGGFNYTIHDASLFFHEVHNKKGPVDGRPCVFFLTLKPHCDDPNLVGTCLGMCGPATETDVDGGLSELDHLRSEAQLPKYTRGCQDSAVAWTGSCPLRKFVA